MTLERLAKIIADRGHCSRRQAEQLILAGKVQVDGLCHTELGKKVSPEAPITIEGKALPLKESSRIWLFHKPAEMICSNHDPEGRLTVFQHLKRKYPELPRLISVGRLDYLSEGLLLLTNNGELARSLELPSKEMLRVYDVQLFGDISSQIIRELAKGIHVEGMWYAPITLKKISKTDTSAPWYRFTLSEGKNREIRRILKHYNLKLKRLKRIQYGPFSLGELNKGELMEDSPKKLKK